MQIFGNKKQHSIFFLFPLLFFAVLLFVLSFKIVNAQSTSTLPSPFYDNFDSYSIGDIFGQGFWGSADSSLNKFFVRSDEGHWVSDYNSFFNSQAGYMEASTTEIIDKGSFFFFLDVLTTTIDSPSIIFYQANTPFVNGAVFQLWFDRIDSSHYCVSIIGTCENSFALSTSTITSGNFYKVGIIWDLTRKKIRIFDGSSWSIEYDQNIPNEWNFGINKIGFNQNYPWSFYIDDITDNTFFMPTKPPTGNLPPLKQQVYEGCNSWGLASLICQSLVYLFIPDDIYLKQFADLKDTLLNKPPFGYYTEIKNALLGINASSTPAFLFSAIGAIQTDIFTPIDFGIAGILWLFFAIWVIKRIGEFVP